MVGRKLVPVSAYYKVERGDEWGMAYIVDVPAGATDEEILSAAREKLEQHVKDNYFTLERVDYVRIDRPGTIY